VTGLPRLAFIVESGTDVRLVEGLATRSQLTVVARRIAGGREISQTTDASADVVIGPGSVLAFAWTALRWAIRHRGDVDAVLVQGYGPSALACNVAARLTGVDTVMLVCSPVAEYYACRRLDTTGRPYRWHESLAIDVLARLNAWLGRRYVVLSEYLGGVVRTYRASASVAVIPVYGVDTEVFNPSTEPRREIRRRLGLPETPALIFFSSRIAPEKDPDTLLDAVRLLRNQGRDVRILHLSGGYEAFRQRAGDRALSDAVIAGAAVPPFAGLAQWYQAADLCVQASREEGLGFSPLEALACEIPVVAASVGGLCETIREPETGWIYHPGDAGALARAIQSVLDDPDEGVRRARRGRAMVMRAYERRHAFDALMKELSPNANPPTSSAVGAQ
jgi:glycosyltransferase involved in cell wall biosynthesis